MVILPQAAQLLVCHFSAQVEGGDGSACTDIPEFHRLVPRGRDQLGAVRAPADLKDLKQGGIEREGYDINVQLIKIANFGCKESALEE